MAFLILGCFLSLIFHYFGIFKFKPVVFKVGKKIELDSVEESQISKA
jgi:hypothetical protein